MKNLPNKSLNDDDHSAFILVCMYVIDFLQNSSEPTAPDTLNAISGYKRLLDKSRFNSPYTTGEVKNLILASDMFLSDMRQTVSFMDDPALRSETRKRMRQVEAFRSKLSPET